MVEISPAEDRMPPVQIKPMTPPLSSNHALAPARQTTRARLLLMVIGRQDDHHAARPPTHCRQNNQQPGKRARCNSPWSTSARRVLAGCQPIQGATGNQNVDWKNSVSHNPTSPSRTRTKAKALISCLALSLRLGGRARGAENGSPNHLATPPIMESQFGMSTGIVPVLGEDTQFPVCDPVAIGPRTLHGLPNAAPPPLPPPAVQVQRCTAAVRDTLAGWVNRSCMQIL